MIELSRTEADRRTRIRQLVNGPVAVRLLGENKNAPTFSVSPYEIVQHLEALHCQTDEKEVRAAALEGGLEHGWQFDAATNRVTFTQPEYTEAEAPVAPGLSAAEMAKALTPADRASIHWNQSAELKQRYPSLKQYQEHVALGLA